jgi:hypothetical protein
LRKEKKNQLLNKIQENEDQRRRILKEENPELDDDEIESMVLQAETEEDKLLKDCDLALAHYELTSDYETDDDNCDRIIRKQPDYRSRKVSLIMDHKDSIIVISLTFHVYIWLY